MAILEARDRMGGTWDLFRYPGVRSDSDMPTLGYTFRPWTGERAIADGPSILQYVKDTAAEFGLDKLIHYGHRATSASWDTGTAQWTINVETPDGPRWRRRLEPHRIVLARQDDSYKIMSGM